MHFLFLALFLSSMYDLCTYNVYMHTTYFVNRCTYSTLESATLMAVVAIAVARRMQWSTMRILTR